MLPHTLHVYETVETAFKRRLLVSAASMGHCGFGLGSLDFTLEICEAINH